MGDMKQIVNEILKQSLIKYAEAEYICSLSDLKGNWEKYSCFGVAYPSRTDDLHIRDALIGEGRILEENLEDHIYVDLMRIGKKGLSEVLVVTKVDGNAIYIGAYAKEGIIKQHLAEKAVEKAKLLLTE